MTQHLGHDGDVGAGGQAQRRRPVPKVVQSDRSDAGRLHQLPEPLRHRVEGERVPVLTGEDQAVIDVGDPPVIVLGLLVDPVGEQHADRGGVQLHPARVAAGRLHRAEHHPAVAFRAVRARGKLLVGQVHLYELLADGQHPGGQVDVLPPEPDRLAPT